MFPILCSIRNCENRSREHMNQTQKYMSGRSHERNLLYEAVLITGKKLKFLAKDTKNDENIIGSRSQRHPDKSSLELRENWNIVVCNIFYLNFQALNAVRSAHKLSTLHGSNSSIAPNGVSRFFPKNNFILILL